MSNTDVRPLQKFVQSAGVDVWAVLHTLIDVAAADHPQHLRNRRAAIVRRLDGAILPTAAAGGSVSQREEVAKNPRDVKRKRAAEEEEDRVIIRASLEKTKIRLKVRAPADAPIPPPEVKEDWSEILHIKRFLDDPYVFEFTLVLLLKDLSSMSITHEALVATQIGRSVNKLRKHASSRVRQLAIPLLGEWKGVADAWLEQNQKQKGQEEQMENYTSGIKA